MLRNVNSFSADLKGKSTCFAYSWFIINSIRKSTSTSEVDTTTTRVIDDTTTREVDDASTWEVDDTTIEK